MREAPYVEQFAQQNSGKAKVVSIGFDADLATSQKWAGDLGLNTPVGMVDADHGVAFHYDLFRFPGWLLLDSSGNLVSQGTRFDDSVQQALNAVG